MSSGQKNRTRSDRVASLQLPPGQIEKVLSVIRQPEVWLRLSLCFAAAVAIWAITGAWKPNFPYRVDQVPIRDIVARVDFKTPDAQATKAKRDAAIESAKCIYSNNPTELINLRTTLKECVFDVLESERLDEETKAIWDEFAREDAATVTRQSAIESLSRYILHWSTATMGQAHLVPKLPELEDILRQKEFVEFQVALAADSSLNDFDQSLTRAFSLFERQGFLEKRQHTNEDGPLNEIRVYRENDDEHDYTVVSIRDVRIAEAAALLHERLRSEFESDVVADRVFSWLKPQLPTTLEFQQTLSRTVAEATARDIPEVMVDYHIGERLASGNMPIGATELELLRAEHRAAIEQMTVGQGVMHTCSKFGLYAALYALTGCYSFFRRRRLLGDVGGLARLLVLAVVTVALCFVPGGRWPAEVIPLLIFSMTTAIAYDQEIALILSAAVALMVTLSLGLGLSEFVTFIAAMSTTALSLNRLRSRTKLLYVGLAAAFAGMLTSLGSETLIGEPFSWVLVGRVGRLGFCIVSAGLLMTGLLPFIERLFRVQTELSLVELGDVSHPLLQELVRRAPGTYNHSINVASIAEAAAEAIGANGLLVRVGAYFHDIGKMMKPGYFIENQNRDDNRHEQLLPAMSTLIIIAHVKDGADLARQHHLPNPLIDFILQHHGTTLVEYFYRQANKQNESNPDSGDVDEGSYRYPGPKPQTKEAAVLMLADSVESAGRTLVDPGPSRIESLVHDIAMKKLLDGQFDECRLTLRELRRIEESLIKSLTGVYHGRIKYTDQQSA